MTYHCKNVQELLAQSAELEPKLREHLDSCDDCQRFASALAEVDAGLAQLEAIDAPDELVARAHAAIARDAEEPEPVVEPKPEPGPTAPAARRRWRLPTLPTLTLSPARAAVAAAVLLLIGAFAVPNVMNLLQRSEQQRAMSYLSPVDLRKHIADGEGDSDLEGLHVGSRDSDANVPVAAEKKAPAAQEPPRVSRRPPRPTPGPPAAPPAAVLGGEVSALEGDFGAGGRRRSSRPDTAREMAADSEASIEAPIADLSSSSAGTSVTELMKVSHGRAFNGKSRSNAAAQQQRQQKARELQEQAVNLYSQLAAPSKDKLARHAELRKKSDNKNEVGHKSHAPILGANTLFLNDLYYSKGQFTADPEETNLDHVDAVFDDDRSESRSRRGAGDRVTAADVVVAADEATPEEESSRPSPAQQLLVARSLQPDLPFQDASGYWSNNYVPGDPTIRLLESRLSSTELPSLTGADGRPLTLEAGARQYRQPFDPPRSSALAVYAHADHAAISGPTRILLQVGLQATERASGLRPVMNVGVVLDLSAGADAATSKAMRALLAELIDAKQTGDRFSVTVAGRPGGLCVPADEFRYGKVTLATRALFGSDEILPGPTFGLVEAVERAMLETARADDPTAPLGASVILVVTPRSFAAEVDRLESMAHASAVGGIPLSVVGVGDRVILDEIDRLVLAGQGNRRLMTDPSQAESVVDRELHSASQVVARAVRLRVRLQPYVRLISVIGSDKLGQDKAQRVRDAEQSIDLRLARNLGIQADRGDDEEGIQIVIPSYYAGDSHVLLLDVVAERPGPIADVTVRYKDLVYLRNGVTRASLSLPQGQRNPGALERNVLKNLVALQVGAGIRDAGQRLEAGDAGAADAILADQQRLLDGMRHEVQGWSNDPELLGDARMVGDYRAALRSGQTNDTKALERLSDSMQYAGWMKVQPRRR